MPSARWILSSQLCNIWMIGARYATVFPVPVAAFTSLKIPIRNQIHNNHNKFQIPQNLSKLTRIHAGKPTHAGRLIWRESPALEPTSGPRTPTSLISTRKNTYTQKMNYNSTQGKMFIKEKKNAETLIIPLSWSHSVGWRPRLEDEQEANTSDEFLLSDFIFLPFVLASSSILELKSTLCPKNWGFLLNSFFKN